MQDVVGATFAVEVEKNEVVAVVAAVVVTVVTGVAAFESPLLLLLY